MCPEGSTLCWDTDTGQDVLVLHKSQQGLDPVPSLPGSSGDGTGLWLNATGAGARNEPNSSFSQLLPAFPFYFFFYLKSMTINISSFPRHSASPWQAPEQGAASPRGWLMDAHQLFCLLQEECSEEHLSAQNSSEMQLCFTALNGP